MFIGGTFNIKFFWRYALWVWDEDALRTFFWGSFFYKKIEKFLEDFGFLMQIRLIFSEGKFHQLFNIKK
jgi:hypothetical protein